MSTSTDLPERFYRWLSLEQGLSDNSLKAYDHDVRSWLGFLERQKIAVFQADVAELQHFLAELHDLGISARTQARFISGLRAFYRFLRQEKLCELDPSTEVDMPELSKPLPHYLEIQEVDALLEIVDRSRPDGIRDYAIFQLLYACGLRVSELVNLTCSQLYFDDGFIRVIGKGGFGYSSIPNIGSVRYSESQRPQRHPFFEPQGQRLVEAMGIFKPKKAPCLGWNSKKYWAPFLKAFLCNTFDRRGRRLAGGSRIAGACIDYHH